MCETGQLIASGSPYATRATARPGLLGFTLIELAIVLVLIGLIAMVGLPPLAEAYRSRTTSAGVDRFVVAHALARSAGLQYGRVAELHIDAAMARFWVEVDTSGTGVRDTLRFIHDLGSEGLTMTSTRSLLCFDARGLATTRGLCQPADATITFALGGRADTLTTTALGKVLR